MIVKANVVQNKHDWNIDGKKCMYKYYYKQKFKNNKGLKNMTHQQEKKYMHTRFSTLFVSFSIPIRMLAAESIDSLSAIVYVLVFWNLLHIYARLSHRKRETSFSISKKKNCNSFGSFFSNSNTKKWKKKRRLSVFGYLDVILPYIFFTLPSIETKP